MYLMFCGLNGGAQSDRTWTSQEMLGCCRHLVPQSPPSKLVVRLTKYINSWSIAFSIYN